MKKILSVLGLIAILGMTSPVMAAPGGPGGHHGGHHGGPRHGGGHHIAPPHHHGGHHVRHHHGGVSFHVGSPRHRHWCNYGAGYWGNPWYNPRLGWYSDYYYPTSTYIPYVPPHGASFSIRF